MVVPRQAPEASEATQVQAEMRARAEAVNAPCVRPRSSVDMAVACPS